MSWQHSQYSQCKASRCSTRQPEKSAASALLAHPSYQRAACAHADTASAASRRLLSRALLAVRGNAPSRDTPRRAMANGEGHLQAQSPAQGHVHDELRQRCSRPAGCGCQPHASVRARLWTQKGSAFRRQRWQHHGVAVVGDACARRVKLPAVWPIAESCACHGVQTASGRRPASNVDPAKARVLDLGK